MLVIKNNSKEIRETGSAKNLLITKNGFSLDIKSSKFGHPRKDSLFETSFEITDNDKNKNDYTVSYIDINADSISIEYLEKITINKKEYGYYIDESISEATLYYQNSDIGCNVIIKVKGGDIFNAEGKALDTQAKVNKEVLESKELSGILNYKVNKDKH